MEELITKLAENLQTGVYENSTNGQALLEHDLNELAEAWADVKDTVDKVMAMLEEVSA